MSTTNDPLLNQDNQTDIRSDRRFSPQDDNIMSCTNSTDEVWTYT